MNKEQEWLLDLLEEIDALCTQCGAKYSLIDMALYCSVKGIALKGSEIDIAMLWSDYLLLKQQIDDSGIRNREIESLDTNQNMPGWYYRYVDSSTTLFDLDYARARSAHGIGINIHIVRVKKAGLAVMLKNGLVYATESYMHNSIEPNISYGENPKKQSIPRRFVGAFGYWMMKRGRLTSDDFARTVLPSVSEKGLLIIPRHHIITLPKAFFDVKRVTLSGTRAMATRNCEEYLKRRYGEKWRNTSIPYPRESYMAFSSVKVPYSQFLEKVSPQLNDDSFWRRRHRWLLSLNTDIKEKKKGQDSWHRAFFMLESRYRDWKRFAPDKDSIIELYDRGKHDLLWLKLSPYLSQIERYAKQGFAYVIDDDIWSICLELYRRNGRDDFVSKLEELRQEKPLPPIEGSDCDKYLDMGLLANRMKPVPVFSRNNSGRRQ